MKKLTATSPFPHFLNVASKLDLELITANIGYELWNDNLYKGGFPTLDALASHLNQLNELHEIEMSEPLFSESEIQAAKEKAAIASKPFLNANARLINSREAAVIINGKVTGLCRTIARKGGTILLAARNGEGAPINTRECSVSFSRKNIAEGDKSLNFYSAFEYQNEIYYISDDSN